MARAWESSSRHVKGSFPIEIVMREGLNGLSEPEIACAHDGE
jgi:hypothetical protein